jgi:N-acetylmuramic acid 6-phosphate (MurNAc-6-P) etherase
VKTAVVASLRATSPDAARKRLAAANGHLRHALNKEQS